MVVSQLSRFWNIMVTFIGSDHEYWGGMSDTFYQINLDYFSYKKNRYGSLYNIWKKIVIVVMTFESFKKLWPQSQLCHFF